MVVVVIRCICFKIGMMKHLVRCFSCDTYPKQIVKVHRPLALIFRFLPITIDKILTFCICASTCPYRRPGVQSLEQAKRNVVDFYPVVGIMENLTGFFQVLEHLIPEMFASASRIFTKKEGKLCIIRVLHARHGVFVARVQL